MVAVGVMFVREQSVLHGAVSRDQQKALVRGLYAAMDAQRIAEKKCAKCRKLKGHT